MVWNDESGAATLTAPERGSVRVRLDRLRHDTGPFWSSNYRRREMRGKSILKTVFVKAKSLRVLAGIRYSLV